MITPAPFFLLNQKRTNKISNSKIETLCNYTNIVPNEFIKLVAKRTEVSGLNESISYIKNWYGFDDLKHTEKIDFVRRMESPEYYTLRARITRLFKNKKWKK
jgi:hypothetical protein